MQVIVLLKIKVINLLFINHNWRYASFILKDRERHNLYFTDCKIKKGKKALKFITVTIKKMFDKQLKKLSV